MSWKNDLRNYWFYKNVIAIQHNVQCLILLDVGTIFLVFFKHYLKVFDPNNMHITVSVQSVLYRAVHCQPVVLLTFLPT